MKLFQFWDQVEPPAEVARWIDGFRTNNPEFEHVLLNEATATGFIEQHYGAREVAAFRACAMPAMQADYVRLCAIDTFGGVYVDADNQSLEPLSGLIERAPHALMLTWTGLINNAFLMFRRPNHPFIQACLALTTENIERRRFKVENTATGPGVVNAVRAVIAPEAIPEMAAAYDNPVCSGWGFLELVEHARALIAPTPELVDAYRAATIMHTLSARPWLGSEQPAYKATPRHWINWEGPIYREP
jgi:hypothetical protein